MLHDEKLGKKYCKNLYFSHTYMQFDIYTLRIVYMQLLILSFPCLQWAQFINSVW